MANDFEFTDEDLTKNFFRSDMNSSPDFKLNRNHAKTVAKLRTEYDEFEDAYIPIKRSMIGAPNSYKESVDYVVEKETRKRENEKTSFLDVLRNQMRNQDYKLKFGHYTEKRCNEDQEDEKRVTPSQAHILLKKLNKKNKRNLLDADVGRIVHHQNKVKADTVTNLIDP